MNIFIRADTAAAIRNAGRPSQVVEKLAAALIAQIVVKSK